MALRRLTMKYYQPGESRNSQTGGWFRLCFNLRTLFHTGERVRQVVMLNLQISAVIHKTIFCKDADKMLTDGIFLLHFVPDF
jgi:hypothetical protein